MTQEEIQKHKAGTVNKHTVRRHINHKHGSIRALSRATGLNEDEVAQALRLGKTLPQRALEGLHQWLLQLSRDTPSQGGGISDKDRERLRGMVTEKGGVNQVAEAIGVSHMAVYRILNGEVQTKTKTYYSILNFVS